MLSQADLDFLSDVSEPLRPEMTYRFCDCNTGGEGQKTEYKVIYVRARNEDEAGDKFFERFGRSPWWTTCDCCGPDYLCIAISREDEEDWIYGDAGMTWTLIE